MKKLTIYLVVMLVSFTMSSASSTTQNPSRVVVYGVVYVKTCNSEVPTYYRYKIVNASDLQAERADLKSRLENDYPTALRIRMGSSSFDFGTSARAMLVYNFSKTLNNCSYKVLMIQFGSDSADAYQRAVKNKNTWGGQSASMSTMERLEF
jgi:hypothetical protein